MEFLLFSDRCGNSSCMCCELDLYIHLLNDRGHGLFLSAELNGLAQIEQFVALLYSLHCYKVCRFTGFLLTKCCLQMVTAART